MPANYAPLLVGVFWPSAILVSRSEEAPKFAAAGIEAIDEEIAAGQMTLDEIALGLLDQNVERFYKLAQQEGLSNAEAVEFARILLPLYETGDDEVSTAVSRTPEEIVESWKTLSQQAEGPIDLDDFGTTGQIDVKPAAAAGAVDFIRDMPREALRAVTVWQMKDRAGTVGSKGVSPLLAEFLQTTEARVHLIGHSFGGKVVLSALCYPDRLPRGRKAHSMLLLQPAVSHLCFADRVPFTGKPGGFHRALERVERPILSTFSNHDVPLTKIFHLALVRPSDLGEAKIAAGGEPPTIFAALGGFGPRRCGESLVDVRDVNDLYDLDPSVRIYGLRADRTIKGHGDASNPSTWWALYNLARE
jgi:pimeloyl-ACP methyl ester carboxylesterase